MVGPEVDANGNGSLKLKPSESRGKNIQCRAAVAYGPGEPFVVEQVIVHPPQKMEVRIKILYTSICHTDLACWKAENEAQRAFPRIFGHEASGVVESVGEGVTDIREGDIVVPIFNGECGECCYCKSSVTNMCERFGVNPMKKVMESDGKSRFTTVQGKPIYHFLNTSTFAEYTVVDSACVVNINPQLAPNLKQLTLISCGVSTGISIEISEEDVNCLSGSSIDWNGNGMMNLFRRLFANKSEVIGKIIGCLK